MATNSQCYGQKVSFSKAQVCEYTDYIGTTFKFRPGTVEVVKVGINNKNIKYKRNAVGL